MLKPRFDILLNIYIFLILASAAWLWSGLRIAYIPYFSAAALILFACIAYAWIRLWQNKQHPKLDLLVPVGLLFLVYLAIQSWNAGRHLYFDVGYRVWTYSPPPHPLWPSAYARDVSFRVLQWFLVSWVLAIAVRFLHRNGNRKYLYRSILAIVANAIALVCLGIYKFLVTPTRMFGMVEVNHGFFSTFPYTNHAAAYFVMIAALAVGLLLQHIIANKRNHNDARQKTLTVFLIFSIFVCVVGANFSLSRAGIILAWSLTSLAAIYGLIRCWKILKPAGRVNMTAATIAAVAVFYFFISGFGSERIQQQFEVKKQPVWQLVPQLTSVNLDLTVRPKLWKAGWEVFKSHWLYGTGGWGFRETMALHVPEEEWKTVVMGRGRINVHNDPIQFLSEFGLIGTAILLAGLSILVWPIARQNMLQSTLGFMLALGLSLVYIFSLVDLPYRCPAVLWTWVTLLAWFPSAHTLGISEIEPANQHRYKANPWTQIHHKKK